jgi:hypothetical protein
MNGTFAQITVTLLWKIKYPSVNARY